MPLFNVYCTFHDPLQALYLSSDFQKIFNLMSRYNYMHNVFIHLHSTNILFGSTTYAK